MHIKNISILPTDAGWKVTRATSGRFKLFDIKTFLTKSVRSGGHTHGLVPPNPSKFSLGWTLTVSSHHSFYVRCYVERKDYISLIHYTLIVKLCFTYRIFSFIKDLPDKLKNWHFPINVWCDPLIYLNDTWLMMYESWLMKYGLMASIRFISLTHEII